MANEIICIYVTFTAEDSDIDAGMAENERQFTRNSTNDGNESLEDEQFVDDDKYNQDC